jgi:hypothetical protein
MWTFRAQWEVQNWIMFILEITVYNLTFKISKEIMVHSIKSIRQLSLF